jgi:hypothetical protein
LSSEFVIRIRHQNFPPDPEILLQEKIRIPKQFKELRLTPQRKRIMDDQNQKIDIDIESHGQADHFKK